MRSQRCGSAAPSAGTGVDDLADWHIVVAVRSVDVEFDLDLAAAAEELTQTVRAASDAVLDARRNLLASANQEVDLALALRAALAEQSLALDAARRTVVKRADAFDALQFDAFSPICTTFREFAACEVVLAHSELASSEAVARGGHSTRVALRLMAEGRILAVGLAAAVARLAWRLAQGAGGALQLISAADWQGNTKK